MNNDEQLNKLIKELDVSNISDEDRLIIMKHQLELAIKQKDDVEASNLSELIAKIEERLTNKMTK